MPFVARTIPIELLLPERNVGFRRSRECAVPVSMPETPVHIYNDPPSREHNIRTPRQLPDMQFEPETLPVKIPAQ